MTVPAFKSRTVIEAFALIIATLLGCQPSNSTSDAPDATASPQASAIPAPLANVTTPSSAAQPIVMPEGGPLPVPIRGDIPLAPDTLARDASSGYTLSAVFRQSELVGPPRAPEVNAAGIDAARKKTELRLTIDLSMSRMRLSLLGQGFVLPPETEIRARSDRFGHVVVWPGGATYRPIGPGALRALFGERRLDVAPLTPADVSSKGQGGKRIGIRTHRVEVTTRAAHALFDVGRLPDLGEGGILLCRALLDLMNAPPSTQVCSLDELPVRVELRWTSQGSLAFDITGVQKKNDIATSALLVPPATSAFAAAPVSADGAQIVLSPQELAAFRTGPGDVPTAPGQTSEGLTIINATDELRIVTIDGITVAWAAPGARDVIVGLPHGRYNVQWRTFLGDALAPMALQIVPGTSQIGGVDGGK
ncbi:MAG: hypothetical protein FWD69_00225 [Polyangiaceae bacterium]|nr:hypothetical protein [Polyangiaceae bacterium]